jgi:ABC-2 type transport system permease protein
MIRILLIARREFLATVATKGFIFGLLILPALIALAASLAPRFAAMAGASEVRGQVAIVDPTGQVAAGFRDAVRPEAIRDRRVAQVRRAMPREVEALAGAANREVEEAAARTTPILTAVDLMATSGDRPADWLLDGSDDPPRLALVVVHEDALERDADGEFGAYDLYASRALDESTEDEVQQAVRRALVDARIRAVDLDPAMVEAALRVDHPRSTIVSADGTLTANRDFTAALPFLMGFLLFLGVVIGGQTLMTSMIEEKSSRVVEVLLAAVSPFELMAGKLIGQLGIGLLVIALYVGLGLMALYSFAMLGLIDPLLILYLIVFFLVTYTIYGALMLAIGAAVDQAADAQSLMGPVMILLMIPYMLSPMIGRAPNSVLSTTLSFLPPINMIVMMARLGSEVPPPAWQVWLSVLVGVGAAVAAVWFAGKVLKVGLLLHGKPPSIATLIRWARQA